MMEAKLTDQGNETFMIKEALKNTAGIAVVGWVSNTSWIRDFWVMDFFGDFSDLSSIFHLTISPLSFL